MLAASVDRYGAPSVIRVVEVPDPTAGAGEVLVRVTAASVNSGDARMRAANFPPGFGGVARLAIGFRGPRRRILGIALAGTIEAVGAGVTDLAPGDRVAGMIGARMGAHAELAAVQATRLARIPAGVSDDAAAAALFGGTTALYFLRTRAAVSAGDTVLVNGASGSVGSAAVQFARIAGARVTAVTRASNAELVRRLGADRAIDYTVTPLEALDEKFDVVFDAVGNLDRKSGMRLVAEGGVLQLVVAGLGDMLGARGRVHAGTAPERVDDVEHILALVAAGKFDPLVEEVGGLDQVAVAHERIDSGRKVGNLVVTPG